jgi:hypothetical protein
MWLQLNNIPANGMMRTQDVLSFMPIEEVLISTNLLNLLLILRLLLIVRRCVLS